VKLVVSGYHGKIYSGWKLPTGPSSARINIVALIEREMEEILAVVQRKRKSDSAPIEWESRDTENLDFTEDMGARHLLDMVS
jgi:hypothetical protein